MTVIHIEISLPFLNVHFTGFPTQEFGEIRQAFKDAFPKAEWNGSRWVLPVDWTDSVIHFFHSSFPNYRILVTVVSATAA